MLPLLRSLARNRRLLKEFVVRDLKARYVGSSMGFFWSVIFPVINLFVYMFVFSLVLRARWSDQQGSDEVALVMLTGIVVWTAFAETVSRATNALVENSNLIQKVVFPSEVLPLYLTISSLINMSIGLPVVLAGVAWFAFLSPPEVNFDAAGGQVVGEKLLDEAGRPRSTAVRVKLERGQRHDVTVEYSVGGTAQPGLDYRIDPSPLTIPAGHVWGDVLVTPLADQVADSGETVELRIEKVHGGRVGGDEITHTLQIVEGATTWRPARGPSDDVYYPLSLSGTLLALPVLFLLQAVFTAGLGYFLATFNLFLRDTFHLVGVFVTVWMFGTPIFYPAGLVERAGFGWLLDLNPMHWLIDCYRSVLCFGRWPDPSYLTRFAAVGLLFLYLGSTFFMRQKRNFPDLL